jgi:aminoglycoside phosphotransferase family enzyme
LHLGGRGHPVDWLVKMRRLPASRMLDHLIRAGTATAGDIRPALALLSRFYRGAPAALTDTQAYLEHLDKEVRNNAAELVAPRYGLPAERIARVLDRQTALLAREPELFRQRVGEGRIVEGHGDLRPEHICLEDAPVIIDCLEFNRDFRILDCADDLAFLALECERLGSTPLAHTVFDLYREMSGDLVPDKLVDFYKSCRACLRAKLALWHLRDGESADWARWPAVARNYLALAEDYAARLDSRPPAGG